MHPKLSKLVLIKKGALVFRGLFLFCMINLFISSAVFADYTIASGATIDASALTGKSGVLIINGKLTVSSNVYLSGFTSVVINAPAGQIYWTNNSDLTFNAGTSIDIDNSSYGLQPTSGNGNASQRLIIGTTVICVSSNNSNNTTFTFEQFNIQGGLPEYTITSNSPVCSGSPVVLSVVPGKIVSGVTYSYQWSINSAAATFTYNSDKTTASIAPPDGSYTVTCIATANTFSTIKTIAVTVNKSNTWLGVNSNWNDPANWCPGIPTAASNITIPASTDYPEISANTIAAVNNLTIAAGAMLVVKGILRISGTITNNGTLNATNGTIGMNGSSAQTIAGTMFYHKTIQNLIVNNTSSAGLSIASTLKDTLKISGTVTFNNSTAKLNTGDNLNLLSTSTGTASIGILGKGNSITGKAIVDRYINVGNGSGQHGASWQLLSTPTNAQTLKQSWMEDQRSAAGFGTLITGPAGTSAGFDAYSVGNSIKTFDAASNSWVAISSTNNPVYNPKGYMLFIRGDRTVNGITATPTPTILRSFGNLNTGTQSPITVLPDHYESIGNPYASAVDFTLLTRSGGVDNKFYTWDPFLYGSYGVGGYQTLSGSNNWQPVPGGTTAYPSGVADKIIQSGQAVFVHATGTTASSISFNENSKVSTTTNFARKANRSQGTERRFLRVSLYTATGPGAAIADGNAVAFDEGFSNDIDGDDAFKLLNGGENFGIKRAGKILAVEAKAPLMPNDTIFYYMSNLKRQTYQLRIVPENMENVGEEAVLFDKFLNISIPVSLQDTSIVNFSITSNSASATTDRFEIVFRETSVLPVTFISLTGTDKDGNVLLKWNVENESGMEKYEVERSSDGNRFIPIGTVAAINEEAATYEYTDRYHQEGNNYYRISSFTKDGKISHSQIVKVSLASAGSISVFPNPVVDGIINLQLKSEPAGKYQVRLINSLGEVVVEKSISETSGNDKEAIRCPHLTKGIYQLEITKPDGTVQTIKVLIRQ